MTIAAVIFDFDGLILDTETHEYQALQEVFSEYGATLPLAEWGKCVGTHGGFDPYGYLANNTNQPIDPEQVRLSWRKKVQARMAGETARPGVVAYLKTATALGLRIGLASSSSREWVVGHLQQLGLAHYFSCVCCSDDVENVKPDPELYLLALQNLRVDAKHALAFEDSPNGALAAKRAGMYCVAVPNSVTETLPFGDVDGRLASMADMPLEDLLATIDAR